MLKSSRGSGLLGAGVGAGVGAGGRAGGGGAGGSCGGKLFKMVHMTGTAEESRYKMLYKSLSPGGDLLVSMPAPIIGMRGSVVLN